MPTALIFNDYGGPEAQELIDHGAPLPGRGELAIEVKAAGVNPADWKFRQGLLGRDGHLPAPLGFEASGVVTGIGAGIEDFAVGDEVLGLTAPGYGGLATHTVLSAERTVLKPEEISFVDAAAIPVAGATAYDVTHQIELEPDQSMLLLGAAGGVGLMAAQIGRVHKFDVLGVARALDQELVESTGATFIESDDGVVDRVSQIAPGGVELIIDLVGGPQLQKLAPLAKNPQHMISTVDPVTIKKLGGTCVRRTSEALEKITDVIKYGLVDPHVRTRYRLANVREAMAAVESGHTAGKVVVEP